MMKATTLMATIAVALVGCASRSNRVSVSPFASEEDVSSALTVYSACMQTAALHADDRQSDAKTIASAIQHSCTDEWGVYFSLYRQGRTLSNQGWRDVERSVRQQAALKAVLGARRLTEQPSAPGKPQISV